MKPRLAMSLATLLATMAAGPVAVAQVRPLAPQAMPALPTAPVAAGAASAAQATTASSTAATLPSAARVPAKADAALPARSGTAAGAGVRVIEDDSVRIEETRQRGQIARITVQPKGGSTSAFKGYEINVGAGGRDPSQDKSGAGQRVWSVLRF
jgi:hypothetical protein